MKRHLRGRDAQAPKGHCRWCQKPVPPPRRTWCSDACVEEYLVRSSAAHARRRVLERDRGICAACGLDCAALPGLPICPCGKLAHPDQPSAVRHARGVKHCYAGVLHELRGGKVKGYARRFDEPELFPGRMAKAAAWADLTGKETPLRRTPMHPTQITTEALDSLTTKHTAFPSFAAMLAAEGGYRPSIYPGRFATAEEVAELRALADAYDAAQAERGDTRRAHRGCRSWWGEPAEPIRRRRQKTQGTLPAVQP